MEMASRMDSPVLPRQKAVRELDFLDVNSPACNRVETVPFRHASFAETVEMVEFVPPVIEYNASAPNMAYRAHAAPAPMVENDAALMMVHRAHATRVHAAPATPVEYDASAARAAPPPLVDGPVVKVVHVPQVQVVEKIIEIPQLQTIGKIVDILEAQSSRPRRRSLSKQFFMRLTRICAVTTLRRYATWHV